MQRPVISGALSIMPVYACLSKCHMTGLHGELILHQLSVAVCGRATAHKGQSCLGSFDG